MRDTATKSAPAHTAITATVSITSIRRRRRRAETLTLRQAIFTKKAKGTVFTRSACPCLITTALPCPHLTIVTSTMTTTYPCSFTATRTSTCTGTTEILRITRAPAVALSAIIAHAMSTTLTINILSTWTNVSTSCAKATFCTCITARASPKRIAATNSRPRFAIIAQTVAGTCSPRIENTWARLTATSKIPFCTLDCVVIRVLDSFLYALSTSGPSIITVVFTTAVWTCYAVLSKITRLALFTSFSCHSFKACTPTSSFFPIITYSAISAVARIAGCTKKAPLALVTHNSRLFFQLCYFEHQLAQHLFHLFLFYCGGV
mmetsp:Transcript_17857/g.44278  ORF Transcript_17857/g.44278 Transcript_17857/m.44278 type:complete len:319 (-) Transcript_17857:544-1500(-)